MSKLQKFDIDAALDCVDLKFTGYIPSQEAFEFFNLIRVFFGEDFEVPNPIFHYFIVDMLYGNVKAEDFPYSQEIIDTITVDPHKIGIISTRGSAKALTLDSKVYTPAGYSTMADIKVGDTVLNRLGKPVEVAAKSEVFMKPTYKMTLADGRELKMAEDHLNVVWSATRRGHVSNINGLQERVFTAKELYERGISTRRTVTKKNPLGRENRFYVPSIAAAVERPHRPFALDPYTVGLILGDGSICKKTGYTRITAAMDDYLEYQLTIPYELSSPYWKDSTVEGNQPTAFFGILGIGKLVKDLVGVNGVYEKRVPEDLLFGSTHQRIQVLRGLLDTDGSMEKSGTLSFSNTSKGLIDDVCELVRSLGGKATIGEGSSNSTFGKYWKVYIRLPETIVPFRLTRKINAWKQYYPKWSTADIKVAIEKLEIIETEPTQCIMVADDTHTFLTNGYTVTHNSTITSFFYPIVAAIKGRLPVTGPLSHILVLSDSQQGGARDQARIMGNAFQKSKFANEWFESVRCTDTEIELVRKGTEPLEKRHMLIKFKGASALPLDTPLFTDTGIVRMGDVQVGDSVFGANGKLCVVTEKSEVFHQDIYRIHLKDGRHLDVSSEHINSVLVKRNSPKNGSMFEDRDIVTTELLKEEMWKYNKRDGYKTPRLWIKNVEPMEYTEKEFPIDPYTLGLLLGDGHYHVTDYSCKLTGLSTDLDEYAASIPYKFGYRDTSDGHIHTVTILGVGKAYNALGLGKEKAATKFIPEMYFYGSVEQRLSLLQGLIDTDGTIREGNKGAAITSTSKQLIDDIRRLVLSLGGNCTYDKHPNEAGSRMIAGRLCNVQMSYRLFIRLNMPVARLSRKVRKLSTKQRDVKVAIVDIEKIEMVPSQCIAVDNEEHQYIAGDYVRTHNTGGIRSGSRNPVTGDRYALIIADDVIKNEADAYSETIMHNVITALMSDARNAMRAKNTQYVLINTPFHKRDPIYMMVESGGYTPLVTPICKRIYEDMPKEEFVGLWEDMHSYESVMSRYAEAVATNSTRAFNQELMLRVANEEDRLVTDDMIQWYDRNLIMKMLDGYTLYITTDFTTTSAAKSDYSVLAAWAVNSEDDWFLLDLCVRRQELQQQYDELMRMVRTWSRGGRAVEVGVEIDGQQKAHLFTIKERMMKDNLFFAFAKQKGAPVGREGIMSRSGSMSKIDRFRYVVPRFQNHKIYFPTQLKTNPEMLEGLKQLKGATHAGFSTHDDFPDVVTQMGLIDIKVPTNSAESMEDDIDGFVFGDGEIYWSREHKNDDYGGSTVF